MTSLRSRREFCKTRFQPSVSPLEGRQMLSAVVYGPTSAVISDVFGQPVATVATPTPGTLEHA